MTYDPINGQYDLVVTTEDALVAGMKLFAGYQTTEYHRFESLASAKHWLELEVQQNRTKILFFMKKREMLGQVPTMYYQDMERATPVFYGCYTEARPKFLVGKLGVYMPSPKPFMFPIYKCKQGLDFYVIGGTHCGLYRALPTEYVLKIAEDHDSHQLRIAFS